MGSDTDLHHAFTLSGGYIVPKLRFHLLGLANIETHKQNSFIPFIHKIINLARILKFYGHTVYFYGVEGSEVPCDKFFPVSTKDVLNQTYGDYDKTTDLMRYNPEDFAHQYFNRNAIQAILENKLEQDILLCPMGVCQKPVADAVNLLTIEPGIGYEGVFSAYHVFESYAWMHYTYGKHHIENGVWYDAVIPNYYDPDEFPYQPNKQDYLLYFGRITSRKGVQLASEIAKATGNQLFVVGPGSLDNPLENLFLSSEKHIHYHSAVGPEKRAELLSNAKAVLMPTYYIEPFGSVAVEAQLCGTPMITTDWGAFSETVVHGVTGYRCRVFEEFCWAVNNIHQIKPEACREWAVQNYSIERVGKMYEEYFQRIIHLHDKGWYQPNEDRRELDWLKRYY
jgi:glycosyltransferase involved in cell wall biosynthesis